MGSKQIPNNYQDKDHPNSYTGIANGWTVKNC